MMNKAQKGQKKNRFSISFQIPTSKKLEQTVNTALGAASLDKLLRTRETQMSRKKKKQITQSSYILITIMMTSPISKASR